MDRFFRVKDRTSSTTSCPLMLKVLRPLSLILFGDEDSDECVENKNGIYEVS
jgi:hypothetical protein